MCKLAEEGFFIEREMDKYIQLSKKTEKGKELLMKMIKSFEKTKTKEEFI